MVMMSGNGPSGGVCLGTSPSHQTPNQPPGPGCGVGVPPNGPRTVGDGLLMTVNGPSNGSSVTGAYYDIDSVTQPLQVQPVVGGSAGSVATTSPNGAGVEGLNPNGSQVPGGAPGGGIIGQTQQAQATSGAANGYAQPQQPPSNVATQNYSTTGQGTWTGSNTLTYTQAMQPDMQRQQNNYCEYKGIESNQGRLSRFY